MKLSRILIAVAATATLAPTAMAVNELDELRGQRIGSFDATGTGSVIVRGNMVAFGQIDGNIVVRDFAGGAIVKLGGTPVKPKRIVVAGQTVRLFRATKADKSFYVKGRDVRVSLTTVAPSTVSISLFGRGRVTSLSGDGIYHVNNGAEQPWATAALPMLVRPERQTPPDNSR